MRMETRIPFRGWRITSFTTYDSVREKVNAVLALEIMGFALLAALAFYALSRRTALRMALFQRESAELRRLNARLQREIAEREKVQKDLASAEQTLEQSSKLAALGEMSAAVSHELNQPLAAMKTYLAGARLLLRRNRPEEAMTAFHRIHWTGLFGDHTALPCILTVDALGQQRRQTQVTSLTFQALARRLRVPKYARILFRVLM